MCLSLFRYRNDEMRGESIKSQFVLSKSWYSVPPFFVLSILRYTHKVLNNVIREWLTLTPTNVRIFHGTIHFGGNRFKFFYTLNILSFRYFNQYFVFS